MPKTPFSAHEIFIKQYLQAYVKYIFKPVIGTIMKKLILSFLVVSMLLVSSSNATLDLESMQRQADTYNSMIDKAPAILKDILGNEKINFVITRNDGSIFKAGLDMVNARIESTIDGGWTDPTIVITATESALDDVRRSNDPITAFQEQRNSGQINFEANGIMTKAKLKAVLSSTSVLQFGYDLFFG